MTAKPNRPEHHPYFSPSKLDILMVCPCFVSGEAGVAAQKGTDQHAYAAALLRKNETDAAIASVPLSPDDKDNVEWYVDYVRATATADERLEVEQAYDLMDDAFNVFSWGTVDACAGPDVFDYKSDRELRPHDYQMAAYALMRMQAKGLNHATCHLCYGRLRKVVKLVFALGQAKEMIDIVRSAVYSTTKQPNPCEYCGWCRNAIKCSALNRHVAVVAARADPVEAEKIKVWEPSEVSDPATVGRMLQLARIVAPWCDAVEKHAKQLIESGCEVAGWTTLKRAGMRQVTDIPTAFARSGLSEPSFLKCCTLVLGKLEEAYAAEKGVKKAQAKREVAAIVEDISVQKPQQTILVRQKQEG